MTDDRTTPVGLFNYAHSYASSAAALREAKVKASHADSPIRFLYYHAIELYLKSFLLTNGVALEKLRSKAFGHNLQRLLKKAIALGLDATELHQQQIDVASDPIIDRYIETGTRVVLSAKALHSLCIHLNDQIGKQVYTNEGFTRKPPALK